MRCGTARALLPLFLDGALSLREHETVNEHLNACQACSNLKRQYETPLPALPVLPPSIAARFVEELDEALEAEIAMIRHCGAKYGRRSPVSPTNIPWPVTWFSGAVVGVTTSWVIFAYLPTSLHTSPEQPEVLVGSASTGEEVAGWEAGGAGQELRMTEVAFSSNTFEENDAAFSAIDSPGSPQLITPVRVQRLGLSPVPQLYFGPFPLPYQFDRASNPRPIPTR